MSATSSASGRALTVADHGFSVTEQTRIRDEPGRTMPRSMGSVRCQATRGWRTRSRASANRCASYAISATSTAARMAERRQRRQLDRDAAPARRSSTAHEQPLPAEAVDVAPAGTRRARAGRAPCRRAAPPPARSSAAPPRARASSSGPAPAARCRPPSGSGGRSRSRARSRSARGPRRRFDRRRSATSATTSKYSHHSAAATATPSTAAATTPASTPASAPTPIATIDSPRAMITIRPWRSAKCAGHELPALGAEEVRPAHVEQQRERPQRALERAVGERCGHQQPDADRRAAGQADHRLAQARDRRGWRARTARSAPTRTTA